MAVLTSQTRQQQLISELRVATGFYARNKGLLGEKSLGPNQALWIHRCNAIHTFFMNFAIDCVFLDRNLRIKKIYANVKPFRMTPMIWGATSVIEMPAGRAQELQLQIGEELHVGT